MQSNWRRGSVIGASIFKSHRLHKLHLFQMSPFLITVVQLYWRRFLSWPVDPWRMATVSHLIADFLWWFTCVVIVIVHSLILVLCSSVIGWDYIVTVNNVIECHYVVTTNHWWECNRVTLWPCGYTHNMCVFSQEVCDQAIGSCLPRVSSWSRWQPP